MDKEFLKTGGKVAGAIATGAAVVGLVTHLVLPAAPAGPHTSFAFDPSPSAGVAGYRIYYGGDPNTLTNVVNIGNTTFVTLTNPPIPLHARVTAYDANGNESPFSNPAGVLSVGIIANIFAQTNGDLSSSNWADAFPVRSVTNPTETVFYRLRIEQKSNLKTYP